MADTPSPAKRARLVHICLPILLVLFALGWVAYSHITWVDYEVELGITDEARKNPFLAATIFLKDYGLTVRRERSFRPFDKALNAEEWGTVDTIVLVDAYGSLSTPRMQNLLSWVDQGGHLIATASNRFIDNIDGVSDSLFDHFRVEVNRQNGEGMEQDLWALINRFGYLAGMTGAELCPMLAAQTQFSFAGDDVEIGVHFLNTDVMQAEGRQPDAWVGEASSAYMLQFDLGEGMVTLVTSLDLWKNSAVGCLDHAWFLWQLAPYSGEMVFFQNFEYPGVMGVIWRYFDITLMVAAFLLLLWLWYRGVRFGPVRENFTMERRQLMEHIDASAHFLWRIGKTDHLIQAIRDQTLQAIQHKHPQLFPVEDDASAVKGLDGRAKSLTSQAEQNTRILAAKLSTLMELSAEQIHLALWQPIANDPKKIAETMAVVQKIKEKI
mgnify:CR=1 FL=1